MVRRSVNLLGVRWRRLLSLSVLLFGLTEGVWGVLQLCGIVSSGHPRYPVTGSFYNPGPYGCLIGAILPVALNMFLTSRRRLGRVLPAVYVLIAALLLPGGMSRTGWGAAVVGSAVVLAGLYREKIGRLPARRLWLAAGVGAAGLLALVVGAYYLKPDSADGRLLLWKIGCRAATLGGAGWENVAGAFGDAQEDYFASGLGTAREVMLAGTPAYVFNEYIQLAIAFGWPVAVLFAAAMTGAAAIYWRRGDFGNCGVVVALMVVCMASYPFQFVEFKVLTAIAVAGGLLSVRNRAARLAAVAVWLLAAGWFICRTGEVDVVYDFNMAKREQRLGRYEDSCLRLKRILPRTSDPMPLNMLGLNYQAMGRPDSAEQCFMRAANRVPNRLYPHYLLMKLYSETGDTPRMRRQARILLAKPPKTHSTAVEEMRRDARERLKQNSADHDSGDR